MLVSLAPLVAMRLNSESRSGVALACDIRAELLSGVPWGLVVGETMDDGYGDLRRASLEAAMATDLKYSLRTQQHGQQ